MMESNGKSCVTSHCVIESDRLSKSSEKITDPIKALPGPRPRQQDEKIKTHSTENRFLMELTNTKCSQSNQLCHLLTCTAGANATVAAAEH